MKKKITVIVGLINDCNSDCSYCYMIASRRSKSKIPIAKIPQLIYNCSIGFDEVKFCWHGGEPLLVGIDFYKTIVEVQEKIRSERQIEFSNTLQTNGILLDERWLEFLKKNNFHIGLSFDAPPDVHLIQRPPALEKMNVEDYLKIFRKLEQYKLSLGFLCVVTENNVNRAEKIFDFYNSIGATSYSLLPLKKTPRPNCPIPPSNEELFRLYRNTFELWIKRPNNFSVIEPLDTMIRSLLGQFPRSCSFGQPCLKRMISITPEGYVVPCNALALDEFLLGDIFTSPIMAILANRKTVRLRQIRSAYINKHCRECEFVSICRGGCRNTAFWHSGSYSGEYPYCEARKRTFEYLRSRLDNILEKADSYNQYNQIAST